jgi:hypothetical protein
MAREAELVNRVSNTTAGGSTHAHLEAIPLDMQQQMFELVKT